MKFRGWKNFKKNEVVIYAIALMLVTAGYFNYTTNLEQETIETSISETTTDNTTEQANIGDARLVNSNDIVAENKNEVASSTNTTIENSNDTAEKVSENEAANSTKTTTVEVENKKEEIGEAVSTDVASQEETAETNAKAESIQDYFVNSKLERDKGYASMLSTYTKILEDNTISETQKSIAMKEITKINDNKNAISVCENLLSTKGFENSIVLVNNDSVNIVVQTSEKLKTAEVAQIQNIISREFSVKIENIHITEKN